MKKYFLMLAAAFALVSCGGNSKTEASSEAIADSAADQITEQLNAMVNSNDAQGIQELQEKAAAEIQDLYSKGDSAAAEAYKYKIQKFLNDNKAKLEELKVTDLINGIGSVPQAVENTAKDGVEAAKADAQQVKEEAKAKVAAEVEKTENAAKDKANAAIDNVQQKANDKINEATNKAKDDVKKKLGF